MKKIPTLFTRSFTNHIVTNITPDLTSLDLSWVLEGQGIATEKIDGACAPFFTASSTNAMMQRGENTPTWFYPL